ncbi:MAG: hypothetical protein ABS28_03805 [Cryomorphaceae bacterium BACL22 MAG-120619-bin32]|jgi:hypothetical protein|nr:MAG: hypothetical protein ABS28_03805 [Cryomorphaceae bacterium BACL22 MAG-120619-bin32]
MKTLKQQISEYLEAQRPYYGDEEVDDILKILKDQNDDLSNIDSLHKILLLRLIDDHLLYKEIEASKTSETE